MTLFSIAWIKWLAVSCHPPPHLHEDFVGRTVYVHQKSRSGHSLAANNASFNGVLAAARNDHRGETAFQKIDAFDAAVSHLQNLAVRQINALQMRLKLVEIFGCQAGEDFVFQGFLVVFHSASHAA